MSKDLLGIHHVTAITGDVQRNVDFYTGLLGLRLVKVTVNFDDPGAYHLYYGDEFGHPGTILTFFAWPGVPRGRPGTGQLSAVAFTIPHASLDYWTERLRGEGIDSTRVGDNLAFRDPEGLGLEQIQVQALELALRRAGFRVLLLSVGLAQERMARAMRALDPTALALCGTGATLDVVGRLVYAVRQMGSGAPLFEYRGSMPVSGTHNIPTLGSSPSEAVRNLKAMVDGPAFARLASMGARAGSGA